MEIIDLLKKEKPLIDSVIEKYIPRNFDKDYLEWILGKARYTYNVEALEKALSEPIWDFLDRGGKRWRPVLFLLVGQALGADKEKLKDFVVIPELVHNGSLVVDDIEDRSELRRGEPCMHKKFGVDVAINAGNFLYFMPLVSLIKNKGFFSPEIMSRAYEVCIQELVNIHCGQGLDIVWHNGKANADKINESEYLQMCAYKTGTLARLSARLATVLAGGTVEQESILGKFAETIGVAFQIQDDILNLQEKLGKEFGEDIKEGKRTLMVIHALSKASEDDSKELIDILNSHTTDSKKIEKAISMLRKYGSPEYATEYAKNMVKQAWSEVDLVLDDSDAKQNIKAFADFLVEREW